MALNLHNLKPATGAKKKKTRVGRGHGSGLGTYAGRGLKGQKSRSGGKSGRKLLGLKANIQRTPKLGGFKSLKPKMQVVNLEDLEKNFKDNDIINSEILREKGLIKNLKTGVKVLGQGKLTKKLIVKVNKISASAREIIEKNKGQVVLLGRKNKKEVNTKNESKEV